MVGPKRHLLPIFLLSFSALFFYSYHHTTLHIDPSKPTHTFSFRTIQKPHPNFTFILKVLAFNRLDSLSRCLRSLAAADYLSDRVHLHIFVDHFAVGEGSADVDRKLKESNRILEFVDGFDWKFGEKIVHYRTVNVGLQAQWLEAWWPSSENEFVFVLEDDLEVSPLYYKLLRGLIVNYYYNASNYRPYIYGASLQRARFVPGKHGNKIKLKTGTRFFLYQIVGTWGQLLFPKPWKEFRLWYDIHKAKGIKPFLEGMVTTGWYNKMGERIWTPWFIKFIHSRGYYNIYTNFLNERALSVSHRDAGVNYGKTAGPDSQLLLGESSLDFNFLEMQPLTELKWYDFCFREVYPDQIVRSFDELGSLLHSVQKQETILLVSLYGVPEMVSRNLICNFERLNIRNYIFVGSESDFLFDVARQGHPVIVADHFVRSLRSYDAKNFEDPGADLINMMLVKAFVVKKCLEYGYSSWVMDGNLLLVSSLSYIEPDSAFGFYIGKNLELFFVRSSSSAKNIWDDKLIWTIVSMVGSLNKNVDESFVPIMAKLLENKGVRVQRFDNASYTINIPTNMVDQSSLGDKKKIVSWSSKIGIDILKKQLAELGLWMLDADFSCKAVVCHRS